MTHVEFIKAIEEYYGEYGRAVQKKMVTQFLLTYVKEDDLPDLYAATLKSFSSQYKAVPDIAVFNGLLPEKEKRYVEFDKSLYLPAPGEEATESEAKAAFDKMWNKMKGKV